VAVLIILSAVILVSVAFLLWCLAGFAQASKGTLQFTGTFARLGLIPSSRRKTGTKGQLLNFPAKSSYLVSHEGTSGAQHDFLRKA